ncbi:MAG: FIST C-terminal domain-containing protein [Azoarcus sp.]|nr:FIST C-terminal domain-containing protein [Azoarcus sp.]
MSDIEVRFGKSFNPDAKAAVADLQQQVGGIEPNALIFFCSPKYDLAVLGKSIDKIFDCPAIGCTTAGEILGEAGYIEDSIVCAAIASDKLTMKPILIDDLSAFAAGETPPAFKSLAGFSRNRGFALFLIDGLSLMEESVIAQTYRALQGVTLIGASAGGELDFKHTYVYHDGAFRERIAVLALVETTLPFVPLHIQHFAPTDNKLVITEADIAHRIVTEINGLPAAEEYAKAVGMSVDELTPRVLSASPVVLQIGDDFYVRAVQKVHPDGSLSFFCAIDIGLVLRVAKRAQPLTEHLEAELAKISATIAHPALIFGSDCLQRRLEIQQYGEVEKVEEVLSHYPFIGFSTFGEQFCGVHVNYTLTALVLGDTAT